MTKFQYQICIPSYHRAQRQNTLDYLERIGVPKENIALAVQTREDEKAYIEAGIKQRVQTLIYREGTSASDNRNTLLDLFPKGKQIVLIDDDVTGIRKLVIEGQKRKTISINTAEELSKMLQLGFGAAKLNQTVGFGLSLYSNPMFMNEGYSTRALSYTEVFGLINTDLRFDTDLKLFEDADFCARIIKRYGKFIRLNQYTSTDYRDSGGCQDAWKEKEYYAKMLAHKQGDIMTVNLSRQNIVQLKRKGKG